MLRDLNFRRRGLRVKLIYFILGICFLSISAVSVITIGMIRKSLINESINQLSMVANITRLQVEELFNNSRQFTKRLASDRLVEGLFIAFEGAFYGGAFLPDGDHNIFTDIYRSNDRLYGARVRSLVSDYNLTNMLLVSTGDQVILSANLDEGKFFLGRNLVKGSLASTKLAKCIAMAKAAKDNSSVYFADLEFYKSTNRVHCFFCKKALAEFGHEDEGIDKGDLLGVVVGEINYDYLVRKLSQKVGMGDTGHSYLVGPDQYLRSPQHESLDKEGLTVAESISKKIPVKLKSIDEALLGRSGSIQEIGSNGFQVISAYSPLYLGFGVPWAFVVEKDMAEIMSPILSIIAFILGLAAILFILLSLGGVVFANFIERPLVSTIVQLDQTGGVLSNSADAISKSSETLFSAVKDQSDAISDSLNTIEQVKAIIDQTAKNAQHAKKKSVYAFEKTEYGVEVIKTVVQALHEIEESNQRLAALKGVIHEIGAKTNIINDIVLKTQLLSFNASLEAARAGIHGKGFSVVAEEVGTLAAVSGEAAQEISELITGSEVRVQEMVEMTSRRITQGRKVGDEAMETFFAIADNMGKLKEEMESIAQASTAQEIAVNSISEVILRLDSGGKNSEFVAKNTSAQAKVLNIQGENLKKVLDRVQMVVVGRKKGEFNNLRWSELSDSEEEWGDQKQAS